MTARKILLTMITFICFAFLAACTQTEFELGETLVFDGLEITIGENISFTRVHDHWSDYHREYAFYLPIDLTNIGDESNGLHGWSYTIFGPDGTEISSISWEFEDYDVAHAGNMQPGASLSSHMHILYAGSGEYIIEFLYFDQENLQVIFEMEFDFGAVPEIQTEFGLGETFEFDDLEITVGNNISWGTIRSRISDHDGENYFYLPVTLTNIGDDSSGFPWGHTIFGPNGNEVEGIVWDVEADDISREGDALPGATINGYLHILFVGDGEYVIEFEDFRDDNIRVVFDVEIDLDAIPVIQTEFKLGEAFEFEGLEITIEDDISWGTIDRRFSDNDGKDYFYFPVTFTNNTDGSTGFPWSFTIFGPDGVEIDGIAWDVEADDISRSGDIRPGATASGYLHILFVDDGEYVIEFSSWQDGDVQVIFDVSQ